MQTVFPSLNDQSVLVNSRSQFIDAYTSHKITVLSFICSLSVVLLHSYNWRFEANSQMSFNFFVENLFSNGLCRMAVPFFFFRAGYLFFANVPEKFDWQWFKRKVQTRFSSIFIPFLLWCILGFLIHTGWLLFLSARHNTNFVFYLDHPSPWITVFNTYFLGIGGDPLIHLWFLRRLMLFVLLSPIILLLMQRLRLKAFLVVSIIFVCTVKILGLQWLRYINGDMFCYLLGSGLAINRIRLKNTDRMITGFSCFVLWVLFVILVFLSERYVNFPVFIKFLLIEIRNLWGIIAVWMVYDSSKIVASKHGTIHIPSPRKIIHLSFFIYCCHIPAMGIIEHILALTAPFECIRYIGTFSLTAIYAILFGLLLNRYVPRLFSALAGART